MDSNVRAGSSPAPSTQPNGTLAQLVEQRTENPCVRSSILRGTTLKQKSHDGNIVAFLFLIS